MHNGYRHPFISTKSIVSLHLRLNDAGGLLSTQDISRQGLKSRNVQQGPNSVILI